MNDLLEFDKLEFHRFFRSRHKDTLKDVLGTFFRCNVGIVFNPISFFDEHYQIQIGKNFKRTIYHLKDQNIYLFSICFKVNESIYAVGIVLQNISLPFSNTKILHCLANRLVSRFHKAAKHKFHTDFQFFGNDLIVDAIVDHISRGSRSQNVTFLCNAMINLRSITFEDNPFSTGVIITRSSYAYEAGDRKGKFLKFSKNSTITPELLKDNRFWFLADGQSTYFVCNKNLQIFNLFLLDKLSFSEISSLRLINTLKGRDFAMCTTPKDVVICSAIGEEYCFVNSSWRYRDYRMISREIAILLPYFSNESQEAILELILNLIKTRSSSLIWIPENPDDIEKLTLTRTDLEEAISISDHDSHGLLHRLSRSDGSLVLSTDGVILAYGAIANLSQIAIVQGSRVGSGSTAAKFLAKSGVVIKVSQDGEATIFSKHGSWRI